MPSRDEIIAALTASGEFELTEDRSAGYAMRVYKNAPPSLRQVFEATRAHADLTHTLYGGEAMTFADLHRRVAALAHYLVDLGVARGDRVAIGMRNYPEWIVAFWACQAIGALVVALNAWWTGSELALALEDSRPSVLILDGERLERVLPLLASMEPVELIVARRGGAPADGIDFTSIVAGGADRLPDVRVGPDDLSTILYTSGTTGRSKGSVASHRNHVTNLMNTMLSRAASQAMSGAPPPADAPQTASLHTLPFFHIGGVTSMYVGAATGVKMALMYRWNAAEGVDLVERHGLTFVSGVPIVVRQLLESADAAGKSLSSLTSVSAGGAPVPPDLIRRIATQFGDRAAPGCAYGLTETTATVIKNDGADYLARPSSIGRPVPTADIRLVDDQGREAPAGEIGELWCRGPNVNVGYWDNPQATEASFGGGWFRTGDLGYQDEDGLYYIADRKKDIIIRGGENVYCAEVEAALLDHPLVRDAAVVGVPNAVYGEVVGAVIQPHQNAPTDDLAEDVLAGLADKLARFKIPSLVRLTVEDLPRTASGKVLKRALRDRFFAQAPASAGAEGG